MALRVARKIESGQFDSAQETRPVAATLLSMTTLLTAGRNVAIAAGGSDGSSTVPGTRLRLTLDRDSGGNRWSSSADPAELWASTGASVDLVVGAERKFATVEVVAHDNLPSSWRFEAIALGSDEMPDPHRKIGNPKMEGMPIPLVSSREFRLDQPIRVALHVSDAGQTNLGCLVFVAAQE
jgi:hypothetical protein